MADLSEINVATVDGRSVSLREVLGMLKADGNLHFLFDAVGSILVAEAAAKEGLSVSDEAVNDPTDGHRTSGPIRRVAIDRSAPSIEVRRLQGGRFEVVLSDEASHVRRLTLLQDDRPAARIRSADGVCDSRRERFEFALPQAAATWKVRGEDLAGNSVEAELPGE